MRDMVGMVVIGKRVWVVKVLDVFEFIKTVCNTVAIRSIMASSCKK